MVPEGGALDAIKLPLLTAKASKEAFVSNHAGTTLLELCALIALLPSLSFVLQWCCERNYRGRSPISLQFTCVVLPTILAVMSESVLWLLVPFLYIGALGLAYQTAIQERIAGLTLSLQCVAQQHTKRFVMKHPQQARQMLA